MDSKNIRIEAKDVMVKFGNVIALDSFSAKVPEGIVGLLGPNGAGKTTLIKVILGLLNSDRGNVFVNGKDVSKNLTTVRDQVGYMPENECLIGKMKAFEMVSYMGRISGMIPEDAIKRGHEVLDFVGIDEERYREISSFSTGMKQRVKLAQAIVHDPPILLLDEPTNGMDPEGKEDMLDLISKIGKSGKTVLVSSHLLHEVEQVGEYILIIRDGKLIKSGSMKDILLPEEGRYQIRVRGENERLSEFVKVLRKNYDIIDTRDEKGQLTIIIKNMDNSKKIFELAKSNDIQIRYFRPDVLTLEDVFIDTFSGGG